MLHNITCSWYNNITHIGIYLISENDKSNIINLYKHFIKLMRTYHILSIVELKKKSCCLSDMVFEMKLLRSEI